MIEPTRDDGRECGSSIFHCFKRCSGSLKEHTTSSNHLVRQNSQHALQALDAWARFTGALAPSRLSLDIRLDDGNDLKRAIHNLFHVIQTELAFSASNPEQKLILSIRSNPLEILGTDAIQEKWETYEGTPWEAISAAIDVLMNIAFLIRSTVPTATSHLDQHYPRDDDISVLRMIQILLRQRWPSARQTLREQLAYSTYIRRKRLLYQQKREEQFAKSKDAEEEIAKDTSERSQAPIGVPIWQDSISPAPTGLSMDVPLRTQKASASTTFSNEQNSKLYAKRPPRSTTGSTQSIAARHHGIHEYPSQPKLDQVWVRCPLCYRPLPSASFDEAQRYWKDHVDEDVEPFVCLSERCRDPPLFFSRKNKWLTHMQLVHGPNWIQTIHSVTWYCDYHHELEDFNTKGEFSDHLSDRHSELNQYRVRSLLSTNKRLIEREALQCPVCEEIPKGVLRASGDVEKPIELLLEHVEEHLMWLALLCLPVDEPHLGNEPPHSHAVASSATTTDRASIANSNRLPAPSQSAPSMKSDPAETVTLELDPSPETLSQPVEISEQEPDAAWNTYWNVNRGITRTFTGTDLVLQELRQAISNKGFACPIFQYDRHMGWEPSCKGVDAKTMSDVRRHLKREPHNMFVELCGICNEDIIDRGEYESLHKGRCMTVRRQKRGKKAEEQWQRLFNKIKPTAPSTVSPYNHIVTPSPSTTSTSNIEPDPTVSTSSSGYSSTSQPQILINRKRSKSTEHQLNVSVRTSSKIIKEKSDPTLLEVPDLDQGPLNL